MKRPILCCVLAFIAGMFFKNSILGIAFIAILFILCEIFWYLSKKIKIRFVDQREIILLLICSIIGIVYFRCFNFFRVEEVRSFDKKVEEVIGVVGNEGNNKGTYWEYILKNNFITGKKIKSKILLKTKEKLEYGNKIKLKGVMEVPKGARNKNTFDYGEYLKTLDIYIMIESEDIEIINKNVLTYIEKLSYFIRNKVKNFTKENLTEEKSGILNALLIGDDTNISYELEDSYKKAGMLHLLVVSGGHTVFLVLLFKYIFSFLGISKNTSKILYIFVIFIYIFITGVTPSILRAGIGIIIVIIAELLGRQNDGYSTASIVAFIIIFSNPNILFSLSFLLSFGGVIGIMICYPKLKKGFCFMPELISEPLALTIAAQLFVTPIIIYNFNVIYFGGIISNIFTLSLSGIIMMVGIILFVLYLLIPPLVIFPMKIVDIMIFFMNKIAQIFSEIEVLIQYVTSLNIFSIILYYSVLIYFFIEKVPGSSKELIIIRFPNIPVIIRRNLKTIIVGCGIISILIFNINIFNFDKSLRISMIDVGHGDSILIKTPNKKYILIDTGDKYFRGEKTYDSGEQTIIPYLLKQGISKIELLILTHMDSDHIGGYESVANVLKIKKLGLSINSKNKEEYVKIKEIAKRNLISIISFKRDDAFEIDGVKFRVLMPEKADKISEENNDSIVLLMEYNNKKALFMGDLEREGEKRLIDLEDDLDINVLKVGHHGSITSSTYDFIEKADPEIALISVGNRFKSIPSEEVINRLSSVDSKVYRTDKDGEINVIIDENKLYVETTY